MINGKRQVLIAAFLVLGTFAWSQEAAKPEAKSPFGFGFELGLGTESVLRDPTDPYDELGNPMDTYQMLAIKPDLSIGKFGLGFDVTVHFNLQLGSGGQGVEFYEPDWNWVKANKTFLELYLPKIAYARWGVKGDPLFVKLGSFDDGTLGNGFIMGNYSNTRFLPQTRLFGLAFDLDGKLFEFPFVGIETFVGNLARFDVLGTRVYARPLTTMEIPILSALQVGVTIVVDTEPQLYDAETLDNDGDGDSVAVSGIDFRLPVLGNPLISMAAFGDLALQNGGRWGTAIGVGGRFFSFMPYILQLRVLGPEFIPTYFDTSYDLFRSTKFEIMQDAPESSEAYAGWLASLGFSLLSDMIVFNVSVDGPFATDANSTSISDWPHLRGVFTVGEGLLAGFSFDALYEKYLLGAPGGEGGFFEDLLSPENAVIGAKFNYRTGPAVLSLLYNLRYDPAATGAQQYVVTSSLISSVRF